MLLCSVRGEFMKNDDSETSYSRLFILIGRLISYGEVQSTFPLIVFGSPLYIRNINHLLLESVHNGNIFELTSTIYSI